MGRSTEFQSFSTEIQSFGLAKFYTGEHTSASSACKFTAIAAVVETISLGILLNTFAEIELIKPLQKAVQEEGYTTPTPIQAKTIPAALTGKDILGCAQTGTGKTAAFALPILNKLVSINSNGKQKRARPYQPDALILAPTRELAIQIDESFATYGKHIRLRRALIYGGVGQSKQVKAMEQGAHIVVATPGRLLDLMDQRYVELDRLSIFVLDEADRMLDMGFLPDLKRIIKQLPDKRQSLFFSATMPPKIVELSKRLLKKPVSVNVTPKKTSVEKIKQRVIFLDRKAKQEVLQKILTRQEVDRAIVFTRTKRGANTVARKLLAADITAVPIHGNKSQNARQRALSNFRDNRVQVLVATDVAARGIDIDGVTHVVNFDMPVDPEAYVHRIGRTGRAGAKGIAISFCTPDEHQELRDIEKLIGTRIKQSDEEGRHTNHPRPKTSERSTRKKRPVKKRGYRSKRKSNDGRTTFKKKKSPSASGNSGNRKKKSGTKKTSSKSGNKPRSNSGSSERSGGKSTKRKRQRPGRNERNARKKGPSRD